MSSYSLHIFAVSRSLCVVDMVFCVLTTTSAYCALILCSLLCRSRFSSSCLGRSCCDSFLFFPFVHSCLHSLAPSFVRSVFRSCPKIFPTFIRFYLFPCARHCNSLRRLIQQLLRSKTVQEALEALQPLLVQKISPGHGRARLAHVAGREHRWTCIYLGLYLCLKRTAIETVDSIYLAKNEPNKLQKLTRMRQTLFKKYQETVIGTTHFFS